VICDIIRCLQIIANVYKSILMSTFDVAMRVCVCVCDSDDVCEVGTSDCNEM
jgi:hypothetical protein